MGEITDIQLLEKVAEGDQLSFAEFYDRYADRAYGLLLKILNSPSDADDVLQEVFWQVWSRATQFDNLRGTPAAWLILMTRSRAMDSLRRRKRIPLPVEEVPATGSEDDASVDAIRAEHGKLARDALENLPNEQMEAIRMSFFDGLTHSEIAERTEIPLGTVKTRIRSGMTKLRDMLVTNERGSYA